jgi:3-oxoadipate enol-lactonase
MRATLVATNPTGYIGCCSAIRDMDQRWAIADIKLPSLIIAGRSDNATPLKESEFMHSRIAGSELVVLDAGHISAIEQGASFNRALEKFLAGR